MGADRDTGSITKRLSVWLRIALLVCCVIISIVLLTGVWYMLSPTPTDFPWFSTEYKDALPASASDVRHFMRESGQDWFYVLKAKITEEEFNDYKEELGFTPISEEGKQKADWRLQFVGYDYYDEWWSATASLDETYYRPSRQRHTRITKYENGYVYVMDVQP